MSWFIFALICFLGWGCADVFYKKSSDEDDRYSHLKIAVWVGLVMGIVSVCLWIICPTTENGDPVLSISNLLIYSPAALGYIISMVVGYAGMRYLEISIISPVQNASGALSAIVMVIFFAFQGNLSDFFDLSSKESTISTILNIVGTIVIVIGVIALGIVEQRLSNQEKSIPKSERKYKFGALALIFPILYCIFDTIGTAADGIILEGDSGFGQTFEEGSFLTGAGLGEIEVLILYGFTFLAAGIIAWLYMLIKTKKPYNPFNFKTEWPKATASCCEQFGQVFYVYAMARNPVVAAPMIASYCVCSVILSRIFLKEKLKASQYVCVVAVVVGIVALGIAEGIGEL